MGAIRKEAVMPKEFPTTADKIKYPDQGLNVGSLLYRTSNMGYGNTKPGQQDLPSKPFDLVNYL